VIQTLVRVTTVDAALHALSSETLIQKIGREMTDLSQIYRSRNKNVIPFFESFSENSGQKFEYWSFFLLTEVTYPVLHGESNKEIFSLKSICLEFLDALANEVFHKGW